MPSYFPVLLIEVLQGKSVSRTLTNLFWQGGEMIDGAVLDIGGGGGRGSHYRFLPIAKTATVKTVDVVPRPGTDFVLDITKDHVPLTDASQDQVFLFNVLEHLESHDVVLREAHRLLRSSGRIMGTVPFLVNVHPDPHDYVRFTGEGLVDLFVRNGFFVEVIQAIGRGPFLAAYTQVEFIIPSVFHLIFLPIVWLFDGVLQTLKPKVDFKARFPLAYNFIIKKPCVPLETAPARLT